MANLPNNFTAVDYIVFAVTLLISMSIGVFFAFRGDRQRTQGEYLLGGRKMPLIPVAISILFSYMSAILMIGTPAEMYTQGTEFYFGTFGMMSGFVIGGVFFVPLLYPLGLTSAFEYLERRYHSRAVRLLGTLLMIIGQVIYMGIASFAPATALEAITGFPVWATLLITGFATTFYTTIGGMKAVVWTDVFQGTIMLAGILILIIQGTKEVGSVSRVLEINEDWGRIRYFTIDLDPRIRHTIFSCLIGNALSWMFTGGLSQAAVQRYCSLPTLRQAQICALLNSLGVLVLFTLTCYGGIVMFAYYAMQGCDPLGQGLVDDQNQLIPYFVMDLLAYPAIPGLFMSSLFSGAISTMSSSMNGLAAITWEDALKPSLGKRFSEYQKTLVIKGLVAVFGALAVGMSFAITFLDGTVIQAAISLFGPSGGTLSGMFLLGALFPCANRFGALAGGLSGLVMGAWLAVGSYLSGIKSSYLDLPYPNGTCGVTAETILTDMSATVQSSYLVTTSATSTSVPDEEDSHPLKDFYSLSYIWTSTVALVTCIFVGLVVSFLTRSLITKEEQEVPKEYQIPLMSRMCCCLPQRFLYYLDCCRSFETPKDITARTNETEVLVVSPLASMDKSQYIPDEKSPDCTLKTYEFIIQNPTGDEKRTSKWYDNRITIEIYILSKYVVCKGW